MIQTSVLALLIAAIGFGCATSAAVPESEQSPSPRTSASPVVTSTSLSAPSGPTDSSPTNAVPGAADYQNAHKLYLAQNYEAALKALDGFETRHPSSPLQSQIENMRGLCLLLMKHPQIAAGYFQKAIQSPTRNSGDEPYLYFNLAKAQLESGAYADAEKSLEEIHPESFDPANRLKFHFLKASLYSRRSFQYESAREVLTAGQSQSSLSPDTRRSLEVMLDQSLQEISGTTQLEDLYRDFESSPLADVLLFRTGAKELGMGLSGKAEIHLRLLLTRFPTSAYAAQAKAMLQNSEAQATIDRKAVGILLPVKGRYARFAQKSLQAIEMAFRIFDSNAPDTGISLVIEDSGEDGDQAVQALNRLVLKHHVSAVIGPLLSKGADQVAKRADELGIPLLSLARYSTSGEGYMIQSGSTAQFQAAEVARYAIQTLGLKRFAILSPRGKAGDESTQAFWDAVEQMGGTITGSETYSSNETDFRQPVDKLSGLYYTEARQRELDELAEKRKTDNIKKKTRKTEQYFSLPPIVDYQAVFIPDDAKTSGLIMPTFAYRDVDHMTFLGTQLWNSPELISTAQNSAEGAIFVDSFFQGSRSAKTRKFIESYHSQFGVDPTAMEAIAHDAALVLDSAIRDAGDSFSRVDLLRAIHNTKNVDGVTGKISYQDGSLHRELKILTVKGGQISEGR